MPFFGSSDSPRTQHQPEQVEEAPKRTGSLFSRRTDQTSIAPATEQGDTNSTRSNGFFSFRNRNSSDSFGDGSHSISHDPSISAARQKVRDAENAEHMADQALASARAAVREARDHVHILEREALEEARRAKLKQQEAKHVSKSARGLGRHG